MSAVRVLAAAGLLAVGLATAAAAVVVHTLWWGLPLVVAGLAAALGAVGRGWATRLPLAFGYAVGVGLSVVPPAEGGYLVATGPVGWLLILTGLAASVFAIVTLPDPRRARRTGPLVPPT